MSEEIVTGKPAVFVPPNEPSYVPEASPVIPSPPEDLIDHQGPKGSVETVNYADGTSATGRDLPDHSPSGAPAAVEMKPEPGVAAHETFMAQMQEIVNRAPHYVKNDYYALTAWAKKHL